MEKELEQKATGALATAQMLVVDDAATMNAAASFLLTVKALAKQVKATFDAPKKAADAAKKALLDAEKSHLKPLEDAEAVVSQKVTAFIVAERARKQKEEDDAKVALAVTLENVGQAETAMAVLESKTVVEKPKLEGLRQTKNYSAEVVDESKIPDKYWILDTAALNRTARADKEKFDVPGARLVVTEGLAGTGR